MSIINTQRYLITVHQLLLDTLRKSMLSDWHDGLTLDNEAAYIAHLEGN